MDLKVNTPNGAKQREGGGGFSDVLGNVSSDDRKQQGLTNSSRKEPAKAFSYTQKASEATRSVQNGNAGQSSPDIGSDRSPVQQDVITADEFLEEAAELVTRTVAETGETPTREQAAGMMADALRSIASEHKGEAPEKAEEIPADDLIEALAEVISAMAEDAPAAVTADAPADEEESGIAVGGPTVHVITPDSSFLMTEKHVEAAMIAGETIPGELPEGEKTTGFADELGNMLDVQGETMTPEDAELLAFTENAKQMFTGLTHYANEDFTDRSDLLTKVLSKLDSEIVEEGGKPVSDMPAVRDTAVMLSEMIDEAKKELGLTEVRLEQYTGERDEAAPLMQNESVKLSHDMNRSDRTGELDHILNGGRFDVRQDDDAPKTETYDAVRMASELMGSRTETDIPVERTPIAEEHAEIRPPEIQTAEQILERIRSMQDDHTEFTMVLNPESLGKITVKLVMAGERTAVEITAENPETRAVLAARSENLQTMLRENGVELERYQVVSEQENAQFQRQSYDGSSKNPYSRNNEEDGKRSDDEDGESFYDILGNI
jgi:hypothetical protein